MREQKFIDLDAIAVLASLSFIFAGLIAFGISAATRPIYPTAEIYTTLGWMMLSVFLIAFGVIFFLMSFVYWLLREEKKNMTYTYRCKECDELFEIEQKMSDPKLEKCPKGHEDFKKVIVTTPAVHYYGAGFTKSVRM